MSMPTHECCWLITIPDGKTAEGEARTQPHARIERAAFFFGIIIIIIIKTQNVCVQVYKNVINCNRCDFFFPRPLHKRRRHSACASIWYTEIRLMYWAWSLKGLVTVLDAEALQYLRIGSNVNSDLDWHLHKVCWRYLTISCSQHENKWMLEKK